jgi:hypothetical protein
MDEARKKERTLLGETDARRIPHHRRHAGTRGRSAAGARDRLARRGSTQEDLVDFHNGYANRGKPRSAQNKSPTRPGRSTAHSSSMHASWLLLPVCVCPVQGQRRFPSLIRGQGVRSWHRRSGAPRASRCSLVPSGQIRLPNASTPLRGSRISRRVVRIRHAQRHRAS